MLEHLFYTAAGLRARFKRGPSPFLDNRALNLPLIAQVGLVYDYDERQGAEESCDSALNIDRFREGRGSASVCNKDIPR